MKKLSFKNVTKPLLMLCVTVLFLASCSSDDKDAPITFTSLNASKTDVFTEEVITLNIEGTEFRDANLTSSNSAVVIKKITSSTYEISSSAAAAATIYAELSNNSDKKSKSVTLNFYEHGIKDFTTVEGIKVNVDKSTKVLSLLGEPNQKSTSASGLTEYWVYTSKGLEVGIDKNTNIVDVISAYSSNFYFPLQNGTKLTYTNYPYEISTGWKINNPNTTMDAIINKIGAPSEKLSTDGSTLRYYVFSTKKIYLSFYADTENDYVGKTIRSIIVY